LKIVGLNFKYGIILQISIFEKYPKLGFILTSFYFNSKIIWKGLKTWILESNLNFYYEKILIFEFKFIWFKSLNQHSNFYFWENPKLWFEFQIFILNQSHFSKHNFQSLFFSKPPAHLALPPSSAHGAHEAARHRTGQQLPPPPFHGALTVAVLHQGSPTSHPILPSLNDTGASVPHQNRRD
jgi:hypothetical protein